MSDSRLEKFIYAICSMDVSDLPVPLSRIEKLWNCLITGETPDFEPLSRNEKYLMVMLDCYDISNLPAPMSRGEKLLYKIAVGETDLSDVPGYLSRYEELLKYLIENGGISEGDFEYVLYTLNQSIYTLYTTAEKPVKSAILKGQTLVNVIDKITFPSGVINYFFVNLKHYKVNEDYLFVIANAPIEITQIYFGNATSSMVWKDYTSDFIRNGSTVLLKVTCPSNYDGSILTPHFKFGSSEPSLDEVKQMKAMLIPYQEGMENWNIPYFEGMQSVKMPVLTTSGVNVFFEDNTMEYGAWASNGIAVSTTSEIRCKNKHTPFPKGLKNGDKMYIVLSDTSINSNTNMHVYDENKTFLSPNDRGCTVSNFVNGVAVVSINDIAKCRYFSFRAVSSNINCEFALMINDCVPYEPFKSNILTVNEDVTLRGVGDVQDELNCLTGEVTERIVEIVLDGSEDEKLSLKLSYGLVYEGVLYNNNYISNHQLMKIYSNKTDRFCIIIPSTITSISEARQWLSENNVIIQLPLAEESIKTVDLTVVDQDNQPTQLGTFENVTHVSLEAENLIPEVEMEVATHISEELASASPLMDDISTEQQQLETTVDEQSENVDATMIATTEIFEETL